MPKKLAITKCQNIAVFNTSIFHYSVVRFNKSNGDLKYYQVQKNRIKIANYQDHQLAIRRMIKEINYEFNDLFNQYYLEDDFNDGIITRFKDNIPHFYKRKEVDYNTTLDFAGGHYYLLKEI